MIVRESWKRRPSFSTRLVAFVAVHALQCCFNRSYAICAEGVKAVQEQGDGKHLEIGRPPCIAPLFMRQRIVLRSSHLSRHWIPIALELALWPLPHVGMQLFDLALAGLCHRCLRFLHELFKFELLFTREGWWTRSIEVGRGRTDEGALGET